jgi:hypothetical protein
MRRVTTLLAVASICISAAGCTTSFPVQSTRSSATTLSLLREQGIQSSDIGFHGSRASVAAGRSDLSSIPATELWGGAGGGLLVGVGLVATIALGILIGGKNGSSGSSSAGNLGGTGTVSTGTPSVVIQ